MERLFLVSEVPAGYGQQVIHTICQQQQALIVLVKDFDDLTLLFRNHPNVTWIVVDWGRSSDWFADFLRLIPSPNYVVNFSGSNFESLTRETLQQHCGQNYTERTRAKSELTFFNGLTKPADGVDCKVFINVVEQRSKLEKKTKGFSKAVDKFVKGASKTVSSLMDNESDDENAENTPLLSPTANVENPVISDPIEFVRSLLSYCCPCIFGPSELQYRFQTPEELKLHLKKKQTEDIHIAVRKVQEKLQGNLVNAMRELTKKKDADLEKLLEQVQSSKQEQKRNLDAVSEQQNKNTTDKLSNVLSHEVLDKIKQSRSRQTKGKVDFYADKAFQDGNKLIRQQFDTDKHQLRDTHYTRLLNEQLRVVQEINKRYQQKWETLNQRHFGRV